MAEKGSGHVRTGKFEGIQKKKQEGHRGYHTLCVVVGAQLTGSSNQCLVFTEA
jgi:hypothetical protein